MSSPKRSLEELTVIRNALVQIRARLGDVMQFTFDDKDEDAMQAIRDAQFRLARLKRMMAKRSKGNGNLKDRSGLPFTER